MRQILPPDGATLIRPTAPSEPSAGPHVGRIRRSRHPTNLPPDGATLIRPTGRTQVAIRH
ncbi:hypothetical protein E2R62_05415 [Citrobacter rodentium]|uniref:Uncharacterized protein n=1 Tax=Citrobacter rodentium TaxID=67825 RepID=A0A482PV82_CITRO|nr:hypothetical protein E2R62_05415 [Citrobacter rodentium]